MFKTGELVLCIDITNKSFRGRKPKNKNIKWLTKGKMYTVLEPNNPYNASISVINDIGIKKLYTPTRFKKFNRKEKINKLIKIINDRTNDKTNKSIM
jgi:hypothetical protein